MFTKILKYLLYIFLGYLFLGFILLPLILKPQLIKIVNNNINANLQIESLLFNPLIFQITFEKVSLADPQQNNLFTCQEFHINVDPSALLKGSFELRDLSLIDPRIYVVYNKDKSINLLKIIKSSDSTDSNDTTNESNSTNELPHIIIDQISVDGGEVDFRDNTHRVPFEFSFENIGFKLTNFDTQKIQEKNAAIRFYSRLSDGGFIDLKSKMLSLEPLILQGTLDFEASKLYTEWKYMRDNLNLEVADGKVSFSLDYYINLADLNATKIDDFHLALEKLRIKPKQKDKDILNLDSLHVNNVTLLPMQQYVDIESLKLDGLRIKAKRLKDETIDWMEYVKINTPSDKNSTKSSAKSKSTKVWDVKLHNLALEKIALTFQDDAIKPAVESRIDDLNIYANDITLLGEKPFDYKILMKINSKTDCELRGKLAHKTLDLSTHMQCQNFDIVHYRPYITKAAKANLKRYDIYLQSAVLDLDVNAKIYQNKQEYITHVEKTDITLKKLALRKRSTWERLLQFKDLKLSDIELDTLSKEIMISNVDLNRVVANITRKKNGKLNVDGVVLAKAVKTVRKKVKKKQKPYHIQIKKVALNNAKLNFNDRVLEKRQKHTADRIYLKVSNIDSKSRTWLNYRASLRLNKKGRVSTQGKLRHTPLKQKGTINAKSISLRDITPYLQESTYINIDDGLLSFNLKESYAKSEKSPDLNLQGSVKLNSLFVTNANDNNSSLLSMNEFEVKPFTLELFPNRLYIDNILVDSFYVSAKIDENKTFNFAQLTKESSKEVRQENNSTEEQNSTKAVFPVSIVKIDVQNGSAEFQDFSLPIKFRTNIHDLQGVVYAVSNTPGGTTYLNIDGEVDKYGSTKLKGSVDSFNPKEYTDLDFNFKNLSLPAMSGYSATFAGYEIESGKLYLDLGYDIMYGELHATNNIMIKHMKLGRELEGEGINHLPLGFVIALLEDSDGIIDIDMPIEGNVNEPDFKYGALVWKTMGNLIAKAVTSPFKFLGSAMGISGDELEYISFEYGKTHITPPEREKLDKITKMMLKRPKISLEVPATYDEVKDLEVLKLDKLVAMIMTMSGEENSKNAKTALTIDMLEQVYHKLRDDDGLDKLQEKLKEKYPKDPEYSRAYQKSLIELCSAIQNVEPQALEKLAKQRSQTIQSYLVNEKGLSASRVKTAEVVKVQNKDDKELKLELKIDVQSEDK